MNPQDFLSQAVLNQIGRQLGFKNGIPPQFVSLATTLLMSGMAKQVNSGNVNDLFDFMKNNGQQQAGGGGLLGSILDLVKGAIGAGQPEDGELNQQHSAQGNANLNQLFGGKLDSIVLAFAKATGLPPAKAKKILMILAPIVVAYIANKMMNRPNESKEQFAQEINEDYRNPERTVQTTQDGGLLETLLGREDDNFLDDAIGIFRTLLFR